MKRLTEFEGAAAGQTRAQELSRQAAESLHPLHFEPVLGGGLHWPLGQQIDKQQKPQGLSFHFRAARHRHSINDLNREMYYYH